MMELYAALDEPNADVDLILGQLADWHEERGDCYRAECLQWCRREGKRPELMRHGRYFWWMHCGPEPASRVGAALGWAIGAIDYATMSAAYGDIANVWHALRTRGEEPVAGIAEEVGT